MLCKKCKSTQVLLTVTIDFEGGGMFEGKPFWICPTCHQQLIESTRDLWQRRMSDTVCVHSAATKKTVDFLVVMGSETLVETQKKLCSDCKKEMRHNWAK